MIKANLTVEQREAIRAMQRSAPYGLLMLEALRAKPTVFSVDVTSDNACAHRLHEIRGWEMLERALVEVPDVRPLASTPDHDYSIAPAGGDV